MTPSNQKYHCSHCSFNADNDTILNTHRVRMHLKCDQCSYHAIHNRDLNRHKNTMHAKHIPCNSCQFRAKSVTDLQAHRNNVHKKETTFKCSHCDYVAKCFEELQFHISATHNQRSRTRIFSASRRPSARTASVSTIKNTTNDIFRPWSLGGTKSLSAVSTQPSSATPLPRPFTYPRNQTHDDLFNVNFPNNLSNQWLYDRILSFNMEGYRRNKYYLSKLIKSHKFILIFIQEHWMSDAVANEILDTDFKSYEFITTSMDSFLSPEDILVKFGPV